MAGDVHKAAVREQFSKTAEAYAQWATVDSGSAKSDVAFFEPGPRETALDVACGPGTLSLKLAPLSREVVGVDLTEELLSIAAQKGRDQGLANVRFQAGDVESLPFPNESFDLVVCGSALHHFPDAQRVFGEMNRVCRTGGKIGIIDIVCPEEDERAALTHRIRTLRDPSHARALKASEITALFEGSGLRSLRQKAVSCGERFRRWAKTGGVDEADPKYAQLRDLFEGSIEGNRTGWNVRRVDGDLEFDRIYFYACATK